MPRIKVTRKHAYKGPYGERADKVKNTTYEESVKTVLVHIDAVFLGGHIFVTG